MQKSFSQVLILPVLKEKSANAEMLSQMLYGETCEVLEMSGAFSRIKMDFDGVEGWVNASSIAVESDEKERYTVDKPFGIYDLKQGRSLLSIGSEVDFPIEQFADRMNLRDSVARIASEFLNVPFLNGGRSFFGTDASGFVQLVFKVHGIRLPRTAQEQSEHGEVLDFVEESEPGDLAFFDDAEGNINHVGIMLNNGELLHCFGKVRKDALDSSGIFNQEQKRHTHKLRFVKKIIVH